MLRKTSTTALLEKIVKLVVAVNDTGSNADSIIDVMAVVQKIDAKYKHSKSVFNRLFAGLKQSKRIDAVFDVYLGCSIENSERYKRSEKEAFSN